MLWYNILNPRNWPGVDIRTGNNKIDGVYYNLLSSNHVSLAASGSIFLAANSGIKLISPSFVDSSGIRANTILAENYGKIDFSGNRIPLYSGATSGIAIKTNDNNLIAVDVITKGSGNTLHFTNGDSGSPLYVKPSSIQLGIPVPSTKQIDTYSRMVFLPGNTNSSGQLISQPEIKLSALLVADSGVSIGPLNNLDSFSGYILVHGGSGKPAVWQPNTFLRAHYDDQLPYEGLEDVGMSLIRYKKRPVKIFPDGRIGFYRNPRDWSPYPPIESADAILKEFGMFDTIAIENLPMGEGGNEVTEVQTKYFKFAVENKSPFQYVYPDGAEFAGPEALEFTEVQTPDPMATGAGSPLTPVLAREICPGDLYGVADPNDPKISGINGFAWSITKGAYLPMQLGAPYIRPGIATPGDLDRTIGATGSIYCVPEETLPALQTFKPSTFNNISIRPEVYTSFNALAEDIDFLIYGKKTTPYNNYESIFQLNENLIPTGVVPVFKVDANIPNSVSGSPTGVIFTTYLDREKTKPSGWGYDDKGKVCINTSGSYVLASIVKDDGRLNTYADLTVSGYTFSNSVITEDIFLKPLPSTSLTSKYLINAPLTLDKTGKIISKAPKLNPIVPGKPLNVRGSVGHNNLGLGHYEYSIQWDPPVNDGNSTIIKYLIKFSLDSGASWTIAQDTDEGGVGYIDRGFTNQTACTIKNLSDTAVFAVAAQNGVGIGPYSDSTEKLEANLIVPTAPTSLTGTRVYIDNDISEINLSWTGSSQLGTGSFSGYVIEESDNNGNTWYYYNLPSGNDFIAGTEEIITGLNSKTNYLYRISSWNSNGSSAFSYIYFTGLSEIIIDEEEQNLQRLNDWDFGVILFTGVCS